MTKAGSALSCFRKPVRESRDTKQFFIAQLTVYYPCRISGTHGRCHSVRLCASCHHAEMVVPFLILCATGLLAIFSSSISKSPVLPLFARQLGADPSAIVFIAAGSAFAGVACSVPAGILADRYGEKLGWFSTVTLTGRFMAPIIGGGIIAFFTLDS